MRVGFGGLVKGSGFRIVRGWGSTMGFLGVYGIDKEDVKSAGLGTRGKRPVSTILAQPLLWTEKFKVLTRRCLI